mmetsp:Transcript_42534/g.51663  ORF Transcript_42534/g.51663 Transcript_42534/m.51663 type:complete len:456 (+) Transcript_42534:189-1556(+)|eukprot:CAMPEP_0197850320 /NCGR_PEP_ID=MMETSP1438-20131217/15021_1 /TAXON_ID=1461541 /ORGANISM="Pterosperma sp., Strain CCMP1384" /LENGTH=455 /DNA_ID=CAMNT_0043463431 /DNA_START=171 /DNA_END=1538 /DNA_ORIENTATION=+
MAEQQKRGLLGGLASLGGNLLNKATEVIQGRSANELEVVDAGDTDARTSNIGHDEERKALWQQLSSFVGKDVMSLLSIPVWLMEPISTLQRTAEIMEYCDMITKADGEDDEFVRIGYIACFFIGAYPSNLRTWKPFNPILGETYEFCPDADTYYFSEQVSHHPPIAVGHAENPKWSYSITSAVKTKFYGNSVDVFPIGRNRITLKSRGETYAVVPPTCRAHNLVIGRTWVDTFGDMLVVNLTTGKYVALNFKPCGWFGAGRYELEGTIYNDDGEAQHAMVGKWCPGGSVGLTKCDSEGRPVKDADVSELWKGNSIINDDAYGFSKYTHWLNSMESAPRGGAGLLPSDSRLRPDRVGLEKGDNGAAQSAKHELEEKQRSEKKIRETRDAGKWSPRWFDVAEPAGDADLYEDVKEFEAPLEGCWDWNGKYDELRKTLTDGSAKPEEFNPWQYPDEGK